MVGRQSWSSWKHRNVSIEDGGITYVLALKKYTMTEEREKEGREKEDMIGTLMTQD